MLLPDVLDFYDDGGALLKEVIPSHSNVPDFVKKAAVLGKTSPRNLFALAMVDNGEVLKKYATADVGNTWLSALYFHLTKDSLPEEAQKVAATHLAHACESFGLPVSAQIDSLRDDNVTDNIVDITGSSSPVKVASENREEIYYAIERADGSKHYPLNNMEALQAADKYFSQNHGAFAPRERREYAVKVASVADPVGYQVCTEILKYSGGGYSSSLSGHLLVRRKELMDQGRGDALIEFQKIANLIQHRPAIEFATVLEAFDRSFGLDRMWDGYIADPYHATFGMAKTAKGKIDIEYIDVNGEKISSEALIRLAHDSGTLAEHFGHDFSRKFQDKPVAIFKSMPLPQKKLIARLASESLSH